MKILFEHTQLIGSGLQPSAIHTPENIVQIIFTHADPAQNGKIFAKEASTPMGNWANLQFSPAYLICSDTDVLHMKLKYGASSIFVVWKNDTEEGEVVPYQAGVTHSVRHRLAVWATRLDLTKYLVDGDIEFRLDDPVAKISVEFENPNYAVSHEDETLLTPGTSLTLFFRAGDSARYIMGRYFIDRNRMGVTEATTSVDGRNAIGKLLKDQTFDEDHVYPLQNLQLIGEDIFEKAGVTNYWVSTTVNNRGMNFPPNMTLLDGIQELIKTTLTWQLQEDMSGRIGFGAKNDSRFAVPSTYTFERNKDIFSRDVQRNDQDAYSRVCVHNQDRTIEVYRDVNFQFVMGKKKTLHVPVAEGSTLADSETYADELAVLLASVGTIETFVGPFRPHLLQGDNARIIGNAVKLLGLVTSVRHSFGKSGFYTEFVVDSGGRIGRARISDYIDRITGRQQVGQATRLY